MFHYRKGGNLQLMLGGTETAQSVPPVSKNAFLGGRCSKMLCAIPQTYFCALSLLDSANRDYNVLTDLRNCWGGYTL